MIFLTFTNSIKFCNQKPFSTNSVWKSISCVIWFLKCCGRLFSVDNLTQNNWNIRKYLKMAIILFWLVKVEEFMKEFKIGAECKCFTYVTKTCPNLITYSRKPGNYNGTIIFEIDIMKKSYPINLKLAFLHLSKPKHHFFSGAISWCSQ